MLCLWYFLTGCFTSLLGLFENHTVLFPGRALECARSIAFKFRQQSTSETTRTIHVPN